MPSSFFVVTSLLFIGFLLFACENPKEDLRWRNLKGQIVSDFSIRSAGAYWRLRIEPGAVEAEKKVKVTLMNLSRFPVEFVSEEGNKTSISANSSLEIDNNFVAPILVSLSVEKGEIANLRVMVSGQNENFRRGLRGDIFLPH